MNLPRTTAPDVDFDRAVRLVLKDQYADEWEPSYFLSSDSIKDVRDAKPGGWIGHFSVTTGLNGK